MTEVLDRVDDPAAAAEHDETPRPVVEDYASFDQLLHKKPRERDVTIVSGDARLKLHIRAIGSVEYDQLVEACPPSKEDEKKGAIFDQKTFTAKLIAACVTRPRMDFDQASRLAADPNWAGGEVGGLYRACVEICQQGIDVPFTGTG